MGSKEVMALAAAALLCGAEKGLSSILEWKTPTTMAVPAAYGLVVLVNAVGASFTLIVGKARKTYDVPYPAMYAEGKSDSAKKFNCVQRGHQQALETFPTFLAFSLIGGLKHPLTVTLCGVTWIMGRNKWAELYADGGPEARYGSFWSRFIWWGLLGCMAATCSVAFELLGLF